MPRKSDDEEEYCEDCEQPIDECKCDQDDITIDDVNKVFDTAKKGLDVIDKLKKLSTPPEPKPISNNEARWIGQDMIRKAQIDEKKTKENDEKENREHRKWKIETAIKIGGIVVSAIVAIIVASKIFH